MPTIAPFANQQITINTELSLDIAITGNPARVVVEGLLEGFHYHWTGSVVQIRGTATRLVINAPFTVLADSESRSASFNVVPAAPVITTLPQQTLIRGIVNEFIIPVSNNPTQVAVRGAWMGMKYEPHPQGIRVFGEVPLPADADFTITDGSLDVQVATGSLTDTAQIPFIFGTGAAPRWRNIPDGVSYYREIGQTFSLNLPSYALGTPAPVITHQSGTIPPGLLLNANNRLSGRFTTAGIYAPVFRATNALGHANSEPVNFTVYAAFAAPEYTRNSADEWTATASTDTLDVSSWFTQGKPPGRYSISLFEYDPSEGYFEVDISSAGVISFRSSNPPQDGERMSARVNLTNSEGTAQSDTFDIEIDYS